MISLTRVLISSGDFGKEHGKLVKRTQDVVVEIEKSCVLLKKDCNLSTRFQVEKMELQDELELVKKERNDLGETLIRLKENERIVSDRAKRVEERLAKDYEEQTRIRNEKSRMISELNVKVTKLNSQVLEKDQEMKSLQVKVMKREQEVHDLKYKIIERDEMLNACKELEKKVIGQEKELCDLKQQKLVAYQRNEENLKNQVLERDQMLSKCKERLNVLEVTVVQKEQEVRDLNRQKLASHQIIEDITYKQTEGDQKAEELRRQSMEASEKTEMFKKLYLAVERDKLKSDDELKDIKEKQLEADKKLEEVKRKYSVALQAVQEFKEFTLAADDTFKVNKESWECLRRIKTVEEGLIGVLKIKVLDLANSVFKEDVDVDSSIPKGAGESLRQWTGIGESSGNDDDSLDQAGSQFHTSPPQAETSSSADIEKGTEKSNCSGIIVAEVTSLDDEARPGELEYNSDLLVSLVPRRRRSSLGNIEGNKRQKKEAVAASSSQTQIWTSSSDSESEPCSDSHMNHMVRTARFEIMRKTWKSEADVLRDFKKDVELCMDAVCVLYRWKTHESELPQFDVMGGCSLAKYLTNGDRLLRLRKSVSEVEEERPDSFVQCRKIATSYCEKLFSIYRNGNDPLFK